MKILVVTPACHHKSFGAVQQDIYATVELLLEMGNEVTLYTLDSRAQNQEVISKVEKKYQIEIKQFRPQKKHWLWFKKAFLNWSLFDGSAYAFEELAADTVFQNFLGEKRFEVILSFGNYSWPLAPAAHRLGAKLIIRSHNFEPLHFWEELELTQKINPLNFLKLFAKWLGEKKSVRESDAMAAISPKETEIYHQWKKENIFLLPLVSLCDLIKEKRQYSAKKIIDLFYLGATYNVDFHRRGAEEIIKKIAPVVLKMAPGKFRFHLCGSKLPPSLAEKCDGQQIIYEGYVADLDGFFSNMDAGIFPVWSGQGMKQKIFESICRSFPVIVPRVSIGKYPLINGEHGLVVDSKKDFIEKVLSLRDLSLREKLSRGAHIFAEENFNKEKIKAIFKGLIYGKQ